MIKYVSLFAPGAMTKVEALRRAIAEAKEKAAAEQALREKHEARVIEAEREFQEAVQKCETLEQSLAGKESELYQARQAACDARGEAQGALKEIHEARNIAAGKAFFSQSDFYVVTGEIQSDELNSYFLRGVCGPAMQHI